MCELFAMSSLMPTNVSFSLNALARHGGAEGPHRDGWGVAYYADRDVVVLREPRAASESELVRFIERHGPSSDLVISHIRFASFGDVALRNTQPFARELGGRRHVFAHNGDLPDLVCRGAGCFTPIGETDSEKAFCHLLASMTPLWRDAGGELPPLSARLRVFSAFAADMRHAGTANIIYSDSDALFVHGHRRTLPNSDRVLRGLYVLARNCKEPVPDMSDSGVELVTARQALTLVASVPLTVENWQPLADGEVLAIRSGLIEQRLTT